jgi:hypothetical protein
MRFLAALALSVVAVEAGSCLAGGKSKAQPKNTYCTWYNDDSCCDPATTKAIKKGVDDGKKALEKACKNKVEIAQGCWDFTGLESCLACSPDSKSYFKKNKIQICNGLADRLYNACKDSAYINKKGKCVKLSDEYASEDDYKKDLKDSVDFVDGTDGCFNSAMSYAPSAVMAVVAAVAVALF